MRKLAFFSLLSLFLYGESMLQIQKEIYTEILAALFPQRRTIRVWAENPNTLMLLRSIPFVRIASQPQRADVVIIYKNQNLLTPQICNKIVLSESYKLIKNNKDCITGGFFWHKGRPNIIFLEKNLRKHHIHLPHTMEQFIEDEL